MKARVKATGEIVEVGIDYNQDADFVTPNGTLYWQGELDFTSLKTKVMREETIIEAINDIDSIRCMVEDIHEEITNIPDYWTRLEHQYAGMAMQGMLSNAIGFDAVRKQVADSIGDLIVLIAGAAIDYAHALVETLKEEERK